MPYKIRQDGENWVVVNADTDEVKATHTPPDAKEKAERQLDLLQQIEKDPEWDKEGEGNG